MMLGKLEAVAAPKDPCDRPLWYAVGLPLFEKSVRVPMDVTVMGGKTTVAACEQGAEASMKAAPELAI